MVATGYLIALLFFLGGCAFVLAGLATADLLFVAFDVDIVFILGWAVIFQQLGWFGFAEISFFILTLAIGLVYAWRKGVIRWI